MRIFLLADGGSPHTIKWAKSLAKSGHSIFIYGLSSFNPEIYSKEPNIQAVSFGMNAPVIRAGNGSFKKLRYLTSILQVKKCIREFKPDIVHVHFVTSYGLLASLLSVPKLYMSVWGADVYDFPLKSLVHRRVLEFILSKADALFSTSHVMAKQASQFTDKKISVVPFGIDLEKFAPTLPVKRIFEPDQIIIGTVKSLEEKYGVVDLVDAFALLKKKMPEAPLKLLIVGKGSQEQLLKKMVSDHGIENDVFFTGWINVEDVPGYHNQIDIAVFPSTLDSESFGVAVVEASACEKPVIVSRKGGLVEVVDENVTGLVVPAHNAEALSLAIEKLVKDPELRVKLGKAGRERVKKLYNWENNLSQMISYYQGV